MKKYMVILYVTAAAMFLTGCVKNPSEDGVKYLEESKFKEALTQFQEAIERDINPGDAYRGIGMAKWEQEDYEGAREAFSKALENGAEQTGTLYNFLGGCSMKLEDWDAAIGYYNQGLEALDNSDEMAREMKFNIIAAYEQMKDMESARQKLTEYVAEYPDDERAGKEAEFLETR